MPGGDRRNHRAVGIDEAPAPLRGDHPDAQARARDETVDRRLRAEGHPHQEGGDTRERARVGDLQRQSLRAAAPPPSAVRRAPAGRQRPDHDREHADRDRKVDPPDVFVCVFGVGHSSPLQAAPHTVRAQSRCRERAAERRHAPAATGARKEEHADGVERVDRRAGEDPAGGRSSHEDQRFAEMTTAEQSYDDAGAPVVARVSSAARGSA